MSKKIRTVAIVSRNANENVNTTIIELIALLKENNVKVYVTLNAEHSLRTVLPIIPTEKIKNTIDLIIVVGGDGSMLGASRDLAETGVPTLGINRGHLGFLTDINPSNLKEQIIPILNGDYSIEERFLLETEIYENNDLTNKGLALNEVVIHGKQTAHMMDFSITVNDSVMYSQKADGFIISTPTGSTAYNLSAGGPIIEPSLNVICLLPMFPQSLNCRPLIFRADCQIKINFKKKIDKEEINVTCDGQIHLTANENNEIVIKKSPIILKICHPKSYDYFMTLRSKLNFGSNLIKE